MKAKAINTYFRRIKRAGLKPSNERISRGIKKLPSDSTALNSATSKFKPFNQKVPKSTWQKDPSRHTGNF